MSAPTKGTPRRHLMIENLDRELIDGVKRRAKERGEHLRDIVTRALQDYVDGIRGE